jgi:diaminohydroxyphosphoribosylaminopyrimidine deaminase/5-amino-6-(5-phosphoribosylamino)uracil reductase
MQRCLELAKQGIGYVAPNPMVGAVLVCKGKIIGEGFHQRYGGPHAEVNCINSVSEQDKAEISNSVLFVSLEPCSHFGKTPPCTDLIIANKIPEVVIGCRDPSKEVDGRGIEKLKGAGVKVISGILEKECQQLNKRFFTFHTKHRPHVVLKWAETGNGFVSASSQPTPKEGVFADSAPTRLFISNEQTNRLVHKWRSEEASILVGTNTALLDDPELTTRNWQGPSPIRLVVDMDLKLSSSLKIFNEKQRTVIFNKMIHDEKDHLIYYQVTEDVSLVHQIVNALYQMKIQSVIVEGGTRLLQSFIDEEMWDEARVIKNEKLIISNGLSAPVFIDRNADKEIRIAGDLVKIYNHELG